MSLIKNNSFGGMWDLGEFLSPNLIMAPIKQIIKNDAKKSGIDLRNPNRILAAAVGSTFMGTALGSFLGPIGAILGSLLGYTVATGAKYPDDIENSNKSVKYLLRLKALSLAVEIMKEHTTPKKWNKINDSVNRAIDNLERKNPHLNATCMNFDLVVSSLMNAIRVVDNSVYSSFIRVYTTARKELGV
ncbi:MAG: hypothetical protein DWQ05_21880 [Calditrichaeota bacterium]|nr:MAG: hypothetical protein DWQ05_21880 [Calditrichota bacterium]